MLVILGNQLSAALDTLIRNIGILFEALKVSERLVVIRQRDFSKKGHVFIVEHLGFVSQILSEYLSALQEVFISSAVQVPVPALLETILFHYLELVPILENDSLSGSSHANNIQAFLGLAHSFGGCDAILLLVELNHEADFLYGIGPVFQRVLLLAEAED